jgi:hypothetical protein
MSGSLESAAPREDNVVAPSQPNWFFFSMALLAPMVFGFLGEMLGQFDFGSRLGLGMVLGLLLIVFGTSCYCAAKLALYFFETSALRIFIGSSLVLMLATLQLVILVVLHWIANWNAS